MAIEFRTRLNRDSYAMLAQPEMIAGLSPSFVAEWQQQLASYTEYWRWMDGQVWEETDRYAVTKSDKQAPLIFPIQLNPLYTAALIHRYTLFGEVPDTGAPLVRPVAIPKSWMMEEEEDEAQVSITSGSSAQIDSILKPRKESQSSEKARQLAAEVSEVLETLWYQSDGRASMLNAAFVSQSLGGCVWKISYEPWNTMLEPGYPVAFREIEPEFFLPIYSSRDRFNLLGARVGRMIDAYEAKELYGIEAQGRNQLLYMEDWNRETVKVTVDGKSVAYRMPGTNVEIDPSGKHGFGVVPFVYIPHEIVGGFYGVPIVFQLGNLLKEINGRTADIGDAVRNSVERIYLLTNADAADVQVKNLGEGIKILTTGREVPGTQPKRIDVANPPGLPTGTSEFIEFLSKAFWHGAFTPAVAYGEDEGSQRSALTLAFRMWPLTSHIRAERSLWTTGLRVMGKIALKILREKQGETNVPAGAIKITDEHLGHKLQHEWAAMIPRDREAEVNQLILRHQDKQLSAQTSLEMLGDVQDVSEELKRIDDEANLEAVRTLASQPVQQFGAGGGGAGGGGSPTRKPAPKRSAE